MGIVLIEPGTQWPPPGHWKLRTYWQSWRAWWSGDLDQLKTHTPCTAPGGYWARMKAKPGHREVHVPLATDIARTAAKLVAGDTPHIDWEDQGVEGQAEPSDDDAAPPPSPLQETWDAISQAIGWHRKILQGVEMGAALGGWYLRPAWDKRLGNRPLLTVVPADEALPTFLFDELLSVTFVQTLEAPAGWKERSRGEVWRWLEHHEPGQIRHELWLGGASNVGHPQPLTYHPTTAGFEAVIDTNMIKPGILVEFVPNDLPQPLDVLPLGRSAFQGCETLFDSLDEVMASWMQDIKLAKARVLASKEMLEPVKPVQSSGRGLFGRGKTDTTPAAAFDVDAEIFSPLDMPAEDGGKVSPITLVQFAIRFAEHEATALQLIEQILSRAGFAPQTFGMHVEGQLSGTAMRRRERKSYDTQSGMRAYLKMPAEKVADTLLRLNAVLNPGAPVPTLQPTLVWREAGHTDPLEMAQVIELLARAQRLSLEVGVAMAHPDWDDKQVREEVKRLKEEQAAMTAPAPSEFDHPEDGSKPKTDEA